MRQYCSKMIFLLSLALYAPGLTTAQQGWNRIYSFNPRPDFTVYSGIRSVLADTQHIISIGETIQDTAGSATPFNPGESTFLGATDYSGNLLWKRHLSFNSPVYKRNWPTFLNVLAKIEPGKYVLGSCGAHCPSTLPSCYPRPFLYFFNANGDSLRFSPYPYTDNEDVFILNAIHIDKKRQIITAGSYWNKPAPDTTGIFLAKFDITGNFLWRKIVVDTPFYHTRANALKIVSCNRENAYLVAGLAVDPDTAQKSQYCIWKTDTAGNVLWRRNLPKTPGWASDIFYGDDMFFDIVNARNGNGYYFIAAAPMPRQYPDASLGFATAYYCGKLDEEGKVVWSKIYRQDSLHDERSTTLAQQPNGDLLFMGETGTLNSDQSTAGTSLFCTDSMGNVKWLKVKRRYNCPYPIRHNLHSMKLTPDNRIIMGGYIGQFNPQPGCYDTADAIAWLVLTDSLGKTNPDDTLTYPLQVTEVVSPTAVAPVAKDKVELLIYPNPATGLAHVELRRFTGRTSGLSLQLYDGTGRLLQQQPFRNSRMSINLTSYSPGIYYIRIQDKGEDIGGGKLIKQ